MKGKDRMQEPSDDTLTAVLLGYLEASQSAKDAERHIGESLVKIREQLADDAKYQQFLKMHHISARKADVCIEEFRKRRFPIKEK